MTANDYLTPLALELIERARAMAPRLAERARAAEDAGLVQKETIAEMKAAGFFKVLQPKRWGGYEMDPRVFYSVQMALAEGCMATAWIYGVVGVWMFFLTAIACQVGALSTLQHSLLAPFTILAIYNASVYLINAFVLRG